MFLIDWLVADLSHFKVTTSYQVECSHYPSDLIIVVDGNEPG